MKKYFSFALSIILVLLVSAAFSQDSCKVLKPEIAGKYTGKCKKGLAQGSGTAEGTDKYTGNFKNGLPDGNGKYTWANGDIYSGSWKEGKRNGEGKFIYKVNGVDSVKYGIWENDAFIKKMSPVPYKTYVVRNVDRYSVVKSDEGNKISLELIRMGKTNVNVSNLDFFADNGTYQQSGSSYAYTNVLFPVVVKVTYTTSGKFEVGVQDQGKSNEMSSSAQSISVVFEVTINEPGDWTITLNN